MASETEPPVLTSKDYACAERLLVENLTAVARNTMVVPHWINAEDAFWYRRETPTGHEFIRVEAATGVKTPAFDHSAAAEVLGSALGRTVGAEALPVHAIDFAPGGRSIVLTVEGRRLDYDPAAGRCNELVSPDAPPKVLVSPDGKRGVFSRRGNLWLIDLSTAEEHALTTDGEPQFGYGVYPDGWKAAFIPRLREGDVHPPMASFWSPDSTKVIVSRVDQRHVATYPFLETVPADGSFRPIVHEPRLPLVGEPAATLEWFVFDIPASDHRRLDLPYEQLLVVQQDLLAVRKTWWSKDCSHLFAVAFGDNMEGAFLFDVDIATGRSRTVLKESGVPHFDLNTTSYNPTNVEVVGDLDAVVWFSQRDGWGHLYLYDGRTGELQNQITRGDWLVRDIVLVDQDRRLIYFSGSGREPGNPYYRYLYRVDFDGSNLTLLSPEPHDHLLTSRYNDVLALDGAVGYEVVSPSGAYVVYNVSPLGVPPTAVICTTDGTPVCVFEEADISGLIAAGYRPPEEFTAKAADGVTDLWGVLYKPATFDPSRRYPLVDAEYCSPLTAITPRNFTMALAGPAVPSPAALAALGFIVMVIDARGTTGRSWAFSHAGFGKLNINGLDDHVAAIHQLADQRSYIDAARVGVYGRSYGGWSALRAMVEFPEVYKVGVAAAAPGSMHSMYLDYHWTVYQGRPAYSDGGDRHLAPNEVPENWKVADGPTQAERLVGKLLIVLAELDENTPVASTIQFMDALMKANKDFDLVYLPNQNHYFRPNMYATRRMTDFFVRHLLGVEPPKYEFKRLSDRQALRSNTEA